MKFSYRYVLYVLLFVTSFPLLASNKLPKPYRNLKEVLPFDNFGWYNNGDAIEDIFLENPNITIAVEVGCFLGKSTRHIASLLPKEGKIYAIDHWKGSEEHQEGHELWYPNISKLYEQFLSNVIHANLTHKIVPIRMDSVKATKKLKIKPDLIYLDASHDTKSVLKDLRAWYPFVKKRGILCGDDYVWKSVAKAVDKFAKEKKLNVIVNGTFWRLTK